MKALCCPLRAQGSGPGRSPPHEEFRFLGLGFGGLGPSTKPKPKTGLG